MTRTVSDEQVEEARQMYFDGLSARQISKVLRERYKERGRSSVQVSAWIVRNGWDIIQQEAKKEALIALAAEKGEEFVPPPFDTRKVRRIKEKKDPEKVYTTTIDKIAPVELDMLKTSEEKEEEAKQKVITKQKLQYEESEKLRRTALSLIQNLTIIKKSETEGIANLDFDYQRVNSAIRVFQAASQDLRSIEEILFREKPQTTNILNIHGRVEGRDYKQIWRDAQEDAARYLPAISE